jgi:curli biogenesis system outer membrane secretion channel CsgG
MPTRARPLALAAASLALLVAACAPTTATTDGAAVNPGVCVHDPKPVVAIIEFENTTGRAGGLNVTGLETAATARLITLLENSGCYEIVERSELQAILAAQGLESMAPEALARAAGAGYVVTGAVTRATIDRPGVTALGITVGNVRAQVAVDVRATDLVTGRVVVSQTGVGDAQRANLSISQLPIGTVSFSNPTWEPLLADAADAALAEVVGSIRSRF